MLSTIKSRVRHGDQSGFTLIELLIVIVVLGVLAGIAILAVDQFQGDAKKACTSANSRIDSTVDAANKIKGGSSYTKTSSADCA